MFLDETNKQAETNKQTNKQTNKHKHEKIAQKFWEN